jgi:MoaA/NifB/PqqE/SkfB family radical SAM enzyme
MTRQSFVRIVEDLKNLPYKDGFIVLSINNEPLLHPLLLEFCELISEELPYFRSWFVTNGVLLTEDKIRRLSMLNRPPDILVDDYTADHKIAARVREIMSKEDMSSNVVTHNDTRKMQTNYRIRDRMNLTVWLRSLNEQLSNRAGNQVVSDPSRVQKCRNIVCTRPFASMCVAPNLKTFMCCCDYRYEVVTGDICRQSIEEIWRNDIYQDIRAKMLVSQRRNLPLCRRCDFEWFLGWRFSELP